MTNVWFIGDLHFGHEAILKYCPEHRPFASIDEHNQALIQRWNSVVRPKDKVFVLGDFCLGKHNIKYAKYLNGFLHLIMGNHDNYDSQEYAENFFKLSGAVQYKKGILTHIPVHESELSRFRFNIHGHLHTKCIPDKRYINVSAEQINLTPISWNALKEKYLEE